MHQAFMDRGLQLFFGVGRVLPSGHPQGPCPCRQGGGHRQPLVDPVPGK